VNTSWGTTLDVNGDGYGDIAFGNVGVYPGGAAGVGSTPAISLSSPDGNPSFGWTTASAGDVNGDGFGDFVVGQPGPDGSVGSVLVYHGGPAGLSPQPTATIAGLEINGGFGTVLASAGDVNGDGYADIIVGANGTNHGQGSAYIFEGGPTGLGSTPAATLLSPDSGQADFGFSVATSGDVNGDGFGDVIVGAPGFTAGPSYTNHAFVYLGGPEGLSTTPQAMLTNAAGPPGPAGGEFGWSVDCANDVNGDGYADVVVGAPRVQGIAGSGYVYLGGPTGILTSVSAILPAQGGAAQAQQEQGFSVSSPGDIDGDGYADVVTTAPGVDGYTGQVYVFPGSPTGVVVAPAVTLAGPGGELTAFGWGVSHTGDTNGDGHADVFTSALWTGRGYLYYGGPAWLASSPSVVLSY
jgi:hypothetical protein